jgi:hypothetical protein
MILPGVLITFVSFLGFLIPSGSGEKVSIGVTTLLSMTVFLMVITENMPPNSDVGMPIIGSILNCLLFKNVAVDGIIFNLCFSDLLFCYNVYNIFGNSKHSDYIMDIL